MPNPIQPPAPAVPLPPIVPPTAQAPPPPVAPTLTAPVSESPQQAPDQTQTTPRPVADFEPTNDGILFLGINPAAKLESEALEKSAITGKVTIIQDTPDGVLNGHDLKTEAGITGFTQSLKLPPESQQKLAQVLTEIKPEMRDEFAQIAEIWSKGENGENIPSRLVLSGHSDGKNIFSESGRGRYSLNTLKSMAEIMPRAAAQIEDVHISGCNSGFKFNAERFQETFPNLKTFWAYTGTAPSTGTNSEGHLKRWEQVTRGHVDGLERTQVNKGLGIRGETVGVWSAEKGYQADPESLNSSRSDQDMYDQTQAYLNGDLSLPSTSHAGPVYELYGQLHQRLGGLSESNPEYKSVDGMVGRTLKLRFYDKVSENFQKVFEPNIKAVYESVGLEAPDFSKLTRKEAVEAIDRLQAAASTNQLSEAQEKNLLLLNSFRDLSPAIMGPEWIEPFNSDQVQSEREQAPAKITKENIESHRLQTSSSINHLMEMLNARIFDGQAQWQEARTELNISENQEVQPRRIDNFAPPLPQPETQPLPQPVD